MSLRFGVFALFVPDAGGKPDRLYGFALSPSGLSRLCEAMRERVGASLISDSEAIAEFREGPAAKFLLEMETRHGSHLKAPIRIPNACSFGFDALEAAPEKALPILNEWRGFFEFWAGPGFVSPSEEIPNEIELDLEAWALSRIGALALASEPKPLVP